jgi:hypothetical protein
MYGVWRDLQNRNTESRVLKMENLEILKSWSSEATNLMNPETGITPNSMFRSCTSLKIRISQFRKLQKFQIPRTIP